MTYKDVLVDLIGMTETLWSKILDGVDRKTSTGQSQSLHITALGTSQTNDALGGQKVKRNGVNTLLVDDHEGLVRVVANFLFQSNNLLDFLIGEGAFGGNKLLSLGSGLVEEA